jgi:phosphatidylinositol alpha-1,6-mannosyltransferase
VKTLLLSPELFRADGGIARIMRLYLKALCESASPGDEVRSLTLNDAAESDPRLARYSTAALKEAIGCDGRKFSFARRALQFAATSDRAICGHLHQLPVLWLARLFNRRLQYSVVVHGIEVWRPYSAAETRALRGATRIFCVSEYTRRQLRRFCPTLDPTRLVVVPNSLDPHLFDAGGPVTTTARNYGPRLLTVSRLSFADSYKGIDTLIEALPMIRRHHPGTRLHVVGGGDDRARLEALAQRLGVALAVEFAGIVGDDALRAEYAACDLFALPSRKEGFGLVFLEAMTHGKPCVGARAGGIPEVVNDRVGALAEYGNIPDIAAAVSDLLRHPRDPAVVRDHAASFGFPAFQQRLGAALR